MNQHTEQNTTGRTLTFRDCEGRAPLVPQDVKTDAAIGVDVGVVDAGGEVDLRGLKRIVGREVDR